MPWPGARCSTKTALSTLSGWPGSPCGAAGETVFFALCAKRPSRSSPSAWPRACRGPRGATFSGVA
eukprot:1419996-Lingulodinium_polyedra.AAC.1